MGFLKSFFAAIAANEISEKKAKEAEKKQAINQTLKLINIQQNFLKWLGSINCGNVDYDAIVSHIVSDYDIDNDMVTDYQIMQVEAVHDKYRQLLKEFMSLGGNPTYLYDLTKMDLYIEIVRKLKEYGWLDRQEKYVKFADDTFWLNQDLEKEQEKQKWLSVLLNVPSNELSQVLTKRSADFIPYNNALEEDVFHLDDAYFATHLQDKDSDAMGVFDAPISIKFTENYILFYSNIYALDDDGKSIYTHDEIYYKSSISNKKVEILTTSFTNDLDGATINDVYVILKKDRPWMTDHFYDIHNLKILVDNRVAYDSINSLSGIDFEKVCKRLLENMGFEVETTKASGDGGIDLIAHNYQPMVSGRYIIQCKRYTGSVGEPIIRDLYGVITSERANKGILITSGTFTKQAQTFAEDKPIELIDGIKLNFLLKKYS